jgi:hypothetical protein
MAAAICDLRVRDQYMNWLALLGLPLHLLIEYLVTSLPQILNYARALIEIDPKSAGVETFHLV